MSRILDLTGQTYGRLYVNSFSHINGHRQSMWNCTCVCGNQCVVQGSSLLSGHSKSCGCLSRETTSDLMRIDLTNRRFGRLTVKKDVGKSKKGRMWLCVCDCGNSHVYASHMLLKGSAQSCGCLRSEKTRTLGKTAKTHGQSSSRLYNIWAHMIQRCYNNKSSAYKNYGERGISVCDDWHYSFETFFLWALEHGYNETLTIERIDVNGNYEPNNCCWIPARMQPSNKRTSHFVFYKGQKMTASDFARCINCPLGSIEKLLKLYNDDCEKIVQHRARSNRKRGKKN